MPSIAIIGASRDRAKYGNKAVRAYSSAGWKVYPVNLKESEVEGIPCHPSVLDLPETPDFASFYVPPTVGMNVVEEVARKGIKKAYFNPGSESGELVEKAKRLG
ncbi:MAG: CoA-binding protein, partial [Candidatus Micrarchaeota archaeon]